MVCFWGMRRGEGHARRLFDATLTKGWDMSKVGAK